MIIANILVIICVASTICKPWLEKYKLERLHYAAQCAILSVTGGCLGMFIMAIIEKFFEHTSKARQILLKAMTFISNLKFLYTVKKALVFFTPLVFFSFACFLMLNIESAYLINSDLLMLLFVLCWLVASIIDLKNVFTSVRSFLKTGIFLEIIISFCLFCIFNLIRLKEVFEMAALENVIPQAKEILQMFLPFLIYMAILCLVWNYFCALANTSVGITANAIVAGLLGVIMLIANTFFSIFPQGYTFELDAEIVKPVTDAGYTLLNIYQIMFNLSTVPLLIINGTAIVTCQLKSYWVEKYNGGRQISDIKQPYIQKTRSD